MAQRDEARTLLVDKVRQYGVWLMAAIGLLPPALVVIGAVVGFLVYIYMRRLRRRRSARSSSVG
jgi:predicted permease